MRLTLRFSGSPTQLTKEGLLTASPLQALVGRGVGSKRYFWAAESQSRLNFAALSSLLIANAHFQADS
jgi:hypothetical protein